MAINTESQFIQKIMSFINHYDHEKYWKRRSIVIDPTNKTPKWLKLYYLLWIKRVDARHHCSFGTNLHAGAYFATPPNFPHGPNGIICGHDIKVGAHCNIYHHHRAGIHRQFKRIIEARRHNSAIDFCSLHAICH